MWGSHFLISISTMDITILVKASLVIHFPLRLWRILSPEPEFLASAGLIPQTKHILTAAFLGKAVLLSLPDVRKARVPIVSLDMMLWKRASCPNICRPASFSRRASRVRLSHSPRSFSICWIFILLKYYRNQRWSVSERKVQLKGTWYLRGPI